MNMQNNEIIAIPLSKLIEDKDNVRKSGRKDGIGELAASIKSQGLLQSLVVKKAGGGKFAVSAGGRRLRALRHLAKAGDLEKNAPIPCKVIDASRAVEASLAENVVRANMHAADEIDAFAHLIVSGEGPEAIAGRFGVSAQHVARRVKLARVSPRLLEAFRKDELDLDQLSALAFSDDHAAQEAAYYDAPEWARTPERLRAQLSQANVPATDKLACFVTLDAYKAAGGVCTQDLFADDEDEPVSWLTDRDLLVRLAEAKLTGFADEVRAEGWAWVEISIDGVSWSQFPERVREQRRALIAAEEAEQRRLYEQLDATEDEAEIDKIEAAIDMLTTSGWDVDEVALAGAIVTLGQDGAPRTERGLVRANDSKALKALRKRQASEHKTYGGAEDDAEVCAKPTTPGLPAKLAEELIAHKTLATRIELTRQPVLALQLLVFSLAEPIASVTNSGPTCLHLKVEARDVERALVRAESKASAEYEKALEALRDHLPADGEALWTFITQLETETLIEMLAVLVAPGFDLHAIGRSRSRVGDLVVQAASLDMNAWWKATPTSYFEHVRKDFVIEALVEAQPALDRAKLDKAPKSELVARCKKAFKRSTWLPAILRTDAKPAEPLSIAAE